VLVPTSVPIFIATNAADFRKQINGLVGLVRNQLGKDPTDQSLYVFFNRARDQVKVLYYAPGGFCIWRKRLERGTFAPLPQTTGYYVALTSTEILMLIDGIRITQNNKRIRYQKSTP